MADKNPWFKFYPSNWRSDQGLRLCSAAARGLWIEMLCLMHEAKPYGHLLVNGRPVTDVQLANLTGIPQDHLTALLGEMEIAGVFSRNSEGTIFSRRMTRDAKRSAEMAKRGAKGGNPALKYNPEDKLQLKQQAHPEDRSQNTDISKDSFQEIVRDFCKPSKPQKTKQEIKAIWQSNILREAKATMPEAEMARFTEAWLNDEPWAKRKADEIDRAMRARKQGVA